MDASTSFREAPRANANAPRGVAGSSATAATDSVNHRGTPADAGLASLEGAGDPRFAAIGFRFSVGFRADAGAIFAGAGKSRTPTVRARLARKSRGGRARRAVVVVATRVDAQLGDANVRLGRREFARRFLRARGDEHAFSLSRRRRRVLNRGYPRRRGTITWTITRDDHARVACSSSSRLFVVFVPIVARAFVPTFFFLPDDDALAHYGEFCGARDGARGATARGGGGDSRQHTRAPV